MQADKRGDVSTGSFSGASAPPPLYLNLIVHMVGVLGWIEISFTTCTRRIYLQPSLETRYTYYGYSSPEPLSWQ